MTSFYLVVDEIVPVDKFQLRIRMWRQAGFPPLVLYTQIPGQPPPMYFSSYLGNFVLRSFFGYALPIPVFFEPSKARKETRAFRIRYQTIGSDPGKQGQGSKDMRRNPQQPAVKRYHKP